VAKNGWPTFEGSNAQRKPLSSHTRRKTGDTVRSKTDLAMKDEALCKIICHNICCLIQAMHEFGVRPDFTAAVPVLAAN